MKRILSILCAAVITIFVTGCGKESSQDAMNQVKINLDQVKSVDFDLHVVSDITVKYREQELSDEIKVPQRTEYVLNVQESNKTAYMNGEILVTGTSSEKYGVESYQTSSNEMQSHYYKEDETWYREDLEVKNAYTLELLKMLYNSGMSPSEESTVNDKPCYVFSADVYGDLAKGFSDMLGVKISESAQVDENGNEVPDDSKEKVKIPVTLSIYKESNYPAYMKVDMKDAIKNTIKDDALSIVVNEAYVEIIFNSFNETSVDVPEDIRKNAVKKQEGTQGIVQEGEYSETSPGSTPEPSSPDESEQPPEITQPGQNIPQETPTPEIITNISNDWNSFQFEYDGAIYRMPMAYKNFEPSGFAMSESDRTKIMEQGQSYTTTLYNGTFTVMAKLENTTTSPKTLYECDIVMVDFDTYSLAADELAKFMFPGNVNFAVTGEQIKSVWGEPSNIHEGAALKIITYTDGDNYIEIYLDPETDAIIEISITAR